ncbi:MAG: helix-hairpin-helix domain-containing protein [Lentisphaeria bacterium]|nr:helix-hairpin-helix domain-containing protein [Lentisphaeria bacterium]
MYYDVTPDGAKTPSGQGLHVGRPRSPSPYGKGRPAEPAAPAAPAAPEDLRRSQTIRVEKPGAAVPPGKPVAPEADASRGRSQTFRVQAPGEAPAVVEPKPRVVAPPDVSDASRNRSQTFRVQAPGEAPAVEEPKPRVVAPPDVSDASRNRSQTFRVEKPGSGSAAPAAPVGAGNARNQSQTFRVAAPGAASAPKITLPPPAKPAVETVEVPFRALAASLPVPLRGPAYDEKLVDGMRISLPKNVLLNQLREGRVAMSLAELSQEVPKGWLADTAAEVALDLAVIVEAIPPEMLASTTKMLEEADAAAALGSFFVPREAVAPVPAAASPAAASPAPVVAPPVAAPVAAPVAKKPDEVGLPSAALLAAVPAAFRGPAWSGQCPVAEFVFPLADIVPQLAQGRVVLPVARLAEQVPAGWFSDLGANLDVPLELVVAAVPPEALRVRGKVDKEAAAAARLGSFFAPRIEAPAIPGPVVVAEPAPVPAPAAVVAEPVPAPAAVVAEPVPAPAAVVAEPVPAPVPEPAPVAKAIPAPAAEVVEIEEEIEEIEEEVEEVAEVEEETAIVRSWDGVEPSLERAPRGVDVNEADVAELMMLPGVGASRAEAIVEWRQAHGRFASIYDLAEVPGIGPSLFRRMTGFTLNSLASRHDRLASLLSLEDTKRPLLARVAEALMKQIGADGCVLTDRQGLSLAKVGSMVEEGGRYAALGSRYFLKTKRHLQQFVGQDADCLIVPGCNPPLLLLCAEDMVTVMALKSSHVSARRLGQARKAMGEIAWLLGCRAVVLKY